MNTNPPVNRLNGSLPKIGIRPAIDGRFGGIRESLEGPVMEMAQNTARFLTENLTHACGLPVECVVADTCIGGVAEAARCASKFARESVGVSLTVTNCWCYGSETMDMDPVIPKAIWGFNGTERPGAVYLAATLAAHNQKGLPCFSIYGRDVQDIGDTTIPADVQQKLLQFARAGLAVATLRGTSYLGMGGVSMGIMGSMVDADFFQDYLGMRTEVIDMTEFVRRMEEKIYDPEEFERALNWTREHCPEGIEKNPPAKAHSREQKDKDWEICVQMTLIARDLMVGQSPSGRTGLSRRGAGPQRAGGGLSRAAAVDGSFPERRLHGGDP